MRPGLKRRLSAWLLMAVFLPMLLLTVLHTHERVQTATADCSACVNHTPHGGHLTAATPTLADCVLCQFFSLQYTEAALVVLAVSGGFAFLRLPVYVAACLSMAGTVRSARAPPFCLA